LEERGLNLCDFDGAYGEIGVEASLGWVDGEYGEYGRGDEEGDGIWRRGIE